MKSFATAAINANEADFDGVEIHGANGYLIDQFLRSNSNQRIDEYGINTTNRIRFLIRVTQAVIQKVGKEKVGCSIISFYQI